MLDPSIETLERAEGIKFGLSDDPARATELRDLVNKTLAVAEGITERERARVDHSSQRAMGMAATASVGTVNGLLAALDLKCHLAHPPEDIETKLDGSGRIIYRCFHDPEHEWDLTGQPLP